MEYTANDFISFIETGRKDKISPAALDLIAKKFRELEDLSKLLPTLEECKKASQEYTEKNHTREYGLVFNAHKNGINWALNYITNKNK